MTDHRLQEYWTESNQSVDSDGAFPAEDPQAGFDERTDDVFTRGVKSIEEFLGAHPRLTVAAAVTLGITLGWLVKRK